VARKRPVFTSTVGSPLDAHNVRRTFGQVAKAGGVGLDVPQATRCSM
jgi:hypothetical protein